MPDDGSPSRAGQSLSVSLKRIDANLRLENAHRWGGGKVVARTIAVRGGTVGGWATLDETEMEEAARMRGSNVRGL